MKISRRFSLGILCVGLFYPLFAQTTGTLSFTCTTAAPSADYGTKHVVALWIQNNEDPSVFIKTNAKYGSEDDHLTAWSSISGKNLVDAVTGATLSSYGTVSAEWDGTDVSHNVVVDGDYSIYIEMGWGKDKTNDHATTMFTFTKGSSAQELAPEGNSHFSAITLNWQPIINIISSVEDKTGVSVFPNPSNGTIKLNFHKELLNVNLEVSDFSGKILYAEKHQQTELGMKNLDLSDIPSGMYLLTIYSDDSYYAYKLVIDK
jgi:hypothetical protein